MKKLFSLTAIAVFFAAGAAFATRFQDSTFTITDTQQHNVPRATALQICPDQTTPNCAVGEQTGEILFYPD